jgi:putative NADH-flavin reductase
MKLVIFGASGKTGRELVKQGLAQGHEITAFVRDPGEFDISDDRLHVVKGDITSYNEVEEAAGGHDAVISALGPHTLLTRVPALTQGIANIVRAMEKTGVRRIVYLSALGAGESNDDQNAFFRGVIRPVLLGRDYADHEANEQAIRDSSLEWVIVRPVRLEDSPHTGNVIVDLHLDGGLPFGRIGRADVADFMLKQLGDSEFLGKAPGIMTFKKIWYSG